MSDAKVSTKWEDMLKEDMEKGSETTVISKVTHGVAAAGALVVAYGLAPYSETVGDQCTLTRFLHLGSLAAHFGTQCWVTFVGGLVMFRTIPRHMFGHLQSYMFPAYFRFGMATNSISLATFLLMHPRGSWGSSDKTQLMALGTALFTSVISAYIVTPQSVRTMWEMYKVEKELGHGMEIGAHYPDKQENPEFGKVHKRFMMWHGVSSLVNLVGFLANGMHLYYLASNVHI